MGSTWQSGAPTNFKSTQFEIPEGDWDAYQLHRNSSGDAETFKRNDSRNYYRQQCALAYLGKRAQLFGGACSKMQARIFTPGALIELDVANKRRRFTRYPWLEKLNNLVAEIERDQEMAPILANVVALVAATK